MMRPLRVVVGLLVVSVVAGCAARPDEAAPSGFDGPPSPPDGDRPPVGVPEPKGGGAPGRLPVDGGARPTWSLLGPVVLATACPDGARGELYVGLTDACGDWSTLRAVEVVPAASPSPVRYAFSVADGVHHLSAFLDCDGDAAPVAPAPSAGDVDASLDGAGCRTYTLHGGGTIALPLTLDRVRR